MKGITDITHVPQFGGNIWYVNGTSGSDTNTGKIPSQPLATIGAAILKLSIGDAINIEASTYTEVDIDLNVANCEMWFEIGSIIEPASNAGLIISANYCKVLGEVSIFPTSAAGLVVSGANCTIKDVKSICATHAGTDCYQISGTGIMMDRCAGGFPSATYAGFNITGGQGRYYECSTVGDTTSYGYHINSGSDTGVLSDCTSVGHQTSGYYIATSSQDWTIVDCSSGAGDGKWTDVDDTNVFSGFTFDDILHTTVTQNASGAYNLFKLTGSVNIISLTGHVETTLVGVNTDVYYDLYSTGGSDNISKTTDTDLSTLPIHSIILKNEAAGKGLEILTASAPQVEKVADPKKKGAVLLADPDNTTYIRWVVTGGDTGGVIHFICEWEPITDDGFLELA